MRPHVWPQVGACVDHVRTMVSDTLVVRVTVGLLLHAFGRHVTGMCSAALGGAIAAAHERTKAEYKEQ